MEGITVAQAHLSMLNDRLTKQNDSLTEVRERIRSLEDKLAVLSKGGDDEVVAAAALARTQEKVSTLEKTQRWILVFTATAGLGLLSWALRELWSHLNKNGTGP